MNPDNTLFFLLPGDPQTRTGGYIYDARIQRELRVCGWIVRQRQLADGFPFPSADALNHAQQTLAEIPDNALTVVDGLALGVMPEQIQEHARRLRLIALIHHPLAAETGLSPQQNRILYTQEKQALAQVRRVIVTSPMTAAALQRDYAVPAEKLGVVIPGTDPAPLATGSQGANLNLICVATLTSRKGHALLLKALAPLTNYPWQLNCVGSTVRDRKTALVVRNLCRTLGLQHKVRFSGELSPDQLKAAYRQADAFVLASYYEGYGMALSEALAYGLPVIATAGGAIAETVPHDAGLLSPVGDRQRLNRSLHQLMTRRYLRQRLQTGAKRARRNLPDWSESGYRFAGELDKLASA